MTRTGTNRERESPRCVLMRQYEMLLQNSNDNSGFRAWFDNNNLFKWRIIIDGPPETPYAGCKFTALLKFPASYPPTMTFLTDILHPNVDRSGQVCISILHPPGTDPLGYEQASERWNRNRTVESILVSVQLLLAEPNFNSPANVGTQWGCCHFVLQRPGTIQGGSATARGAGISIDTASEVVINTTTGRATVWRTAAGDAATATAARARSAAAATTNGRMVHLM